MFPVKLEVSILILYSPPVSISQGQPCSLDYHL